MNKFTNSMVGALRDDINAALEAVAKKYGLDIHAGNATYTPTAATFKLEVVDVQANWESSITGTGLRADDLGKECLFGKQCLTIVGFDNNARANKIMLTDGNGKRFSASVRDTIDALNRANPERASICAASETGAVEKKTADEVTIQQFDTKAFICGLKGRVSYDQTFMYGGKEYKVVDLNTRAPKYPIVGEAADGSQLRFTKDVLDNVI